MDNGMAYPLTRYIGRSLGFAGACCFVLSSPAFAIDPMPSPASQNQTPPALSPQCDVPAADIAAPAQLPNVAKVLAEHGTLHILAIGSAASAGLGSAAGVKSYPVQISDILESALKGVNVEIANRGVGGEVAQTSADRIRS